MNGKKLLLPMIAIGFLMGAVNVAQLGTPTMPSNCRVTINNQTESDMVHLKSGQLIRKGEFVTINSDDCQQEAQDLIANGITRKAELGPDNKSLTVTMKGKLEIRGFNCCTAPGISAGTFWAGYCISGCLNALHK